MNLLVEQGFWVNLGGFGMAYRQQVGSDNPGCIIILVDQSMGDIYGSGTEEKSDVVASSLSDLN